MHTSRVTTIWRGITCLDQSALWEEMAQVPTAARLSAIIQECGGVFHSGSGRLLKHGAVCLRSFGGMPIVIREDGIPCVGSSSFTLEDALTASRHMMGFSGMDAYLNPHDRSAEDMFGRLVAVHGVPSAAHLPHIGVFIAGLSVKAELEFCCQRDIVHLSRLTSAKTRAQDNPPILVENESLIPLYAEILRAIPKDRKGDAEIMNSVFPMSKCSLLGIDGSLKSMLKLSDFRADAGKETEVRDVCETLHGVLHAMYPFFAKNV